MNAEILCVGTELVLGDILNTNSQFLSRSLAAIGIDVFYQSSVGDNRERLSQALLNAFKRSDIVILSGGLGPTEDDITMSCVSEALSIPLVPNKEAALRIKNHFDKVGKVLSQNNLKQALLPENATVFQNHNGTAPGCMIEIDNKKVILLPGPPHELELMFKNQVVPLITGNDGEHIESHFVNIYGIPESTLDMQISDLTSGSNPTVAPYAKEGEVSLRVTAKGKTMEETDTLCRATIREILLRFKKNVYGIDKDSLEEVVVSELKKKNMKVATAESCTAGLISKKITDISGSSAVYSMGVAAYANDVKIDTLKVNPSTIEEFGAVSWQTACEMASGMKKISGSDLAVSVTGIAGPESDDTNKPVGLVYIALADKENVFVTENRFGSDRSREVIRDLTSKAALNLIRLYLIGDGNFEGVDILKTIPLEETADCSSSENEPQNKETPAAGVSTDSIKDLLKDIRSEIGEELSTDVSESEPKHKKEKIKKEKVEKENIFIRILKYLFPWRGDNGKEVTRKIIFLTALIAFVVCLYLLVPEFIDGIVLKQNNAKNDEIFNQPAIVNAEPGYNSAVMNPKFKDFFEANHDFMGTVTVNNVKLDGNIASATSGSVIREPFVQSKNNKNFYLTHSFDKKTNKYGTIYAKEENVIAYEGQSRNITLYGHNMASGDMFAKIGYYKDLSFYKEHPLITFDTLYRDSTYKIFAVLITNAEKNQDNGYAYDYRMQNFDNENQFMNWVDEAKERSIFDTGVDVKEKDEILTLQSCVYDFKDARMIVMARRVRPGEKATVDISKAVVNPDVVRPQIWYDTKGGKAPTTQKWDYNKPRS